MNPSLHKTFSRRRFLGDAALGVVGAGALLGVSCAKRPEAPVTQAPLTPPQPPPTPPPTPSGDGSRVIIARHSGLTMNGQIQETALAETVDRAVMELSGESSAEAAWGKYFSSDEVVGIKVNGLGGPNMATAGLLSKVCVERLQGIGVKPENIIIWDTSVDFLMNCGVEYPSMWGVRVMTMGDEWDAEVIQGQFRGKITAIVTKYVDGYLNLPIMKSHGISGVTLAMKNHYGSCHNPSAHHRNHCDPYIADLNTVPAIRDKQRLILLDGTRCQAQGGPGYNPRYASNPNLILAATDPVAHDTVGWELIEQERKAFGLGPLCGGQQPPQLISAAERGLGTNDLAKIRKVEVSVA